jgi:hypothetical protein
MYPRCGWKCFVYEKKGKNIYRRQARKMGLPLGQPHFPFIFFYVYMFLFSPFLVFFWKHNDCNNNHTHKGKRFFCMLQKLFASWCCVVKIRVVITRAPSIVTTTTIAQKEAKFGGWTIMEQRGAITIIIHQ